MPTSDDFQIANKSLPITRKLKIVKISIKRNSTLTSDINQTANEIPNKLQTSTNDLLLQNDNIDT